MHQFASVVFLFLYGALLVVGLFLSPFWGFLARKRARRVAGRWTLRSDRYFVLACAICVLATGDTITFLGRTGSLLSVGLPATLKTPWSALTVACGLSIVLAGKGMLVWLADLEKEPPVWSWTKWLTGATIAWAITAAIIELGYAAPF